MWFKKSVKKMAWPTPETDYEGNDLWALRFPIIKPFTEWQRLMALNTQQWIPGAQEMERARQMQMGATNIGLGFWYPGKTAWPFNL